MNKRRITSTCWALVMALTVAWAQAPNNSGTYYKNADGKKGQALKTALYGIINSHTDIGYSGLWTAYKTTDKRSDGYLRDWYSNATNYVIGGSKQGANYSAEGDSYNREHLVPQSWFSKASPMRNDAFHVVPTDGYVNNWRGDLPFGEVGTISKSSKNGYSKTGNCTVSGYAGQCFEPNDEIKGDVARAYFYMVTCYENKITSWSGTNFSYCFDGNKYPGLTDWFLAMLMKWSKNDPVDDVEKARNEAVYKLQDNRNPFIDYPGLEDYVWGDKKTVAFSYDNYDGSSTGKQSVTMAFSQTAATATLGETFTAPTLTMSPSGLTVAYSSSNTSVATVNSSTGAVTLKAAGTTTITATFAGNDSYYGNSASYTLTVKTSGGGETPTPSGGVIWEEDWTGASANASVESIVNSAATYVGDGGTNCKIYNEKLAGGTAPELLIPKTSRSISKFVATVNLNGASGELPLSFKCNKQISVTSSTTGVSVSEGSSSGSTYNYTISVPSGTKTLVLTFATKTDANARIDDIKLISAEEEPTLAGDINKDGQVTIADVTALVNILLGKDDADPYLYDHEAADVNGDGSTTIADVTALVNLLLGKGE